MICADLLAQRGGLLVAELEALTAAHAHHGADRLLTKDVAVVDPQ